jgi:hypothetical protein
MHSCGVIYDISRFTHTYTGFTDGEIAEREWSFKAWQMGKEMREGCRCDVLDEFFMWPWVRAKL